MTESKNQFKPDYLVSPGQILADILEEQSMPQKDLAERTGITTKTINEIVNGKARITPDTALRFERVLGVPASFWNNAQIKYDEHKVRLDEERKLETDLPWLSNFPFLKQMIKRGWVEEGTRPVLKLRNLLDFFSVSRIVDFDAVWVKANGAAFRMSESLKSNPYAVAAWLRQGERLAHGIHCKPFNEAGFKGALEEARKCTLIENPGAMTEKLLPLFAETGVAIVFLPELKGSKINGAVRWMLPEKAVIQLSLRHGWADIMWFSFYHEAGHLLENKSKQWRIDGFAPRGNDSENNADRFAENMLIPSKEYAKFLRDWGKTAAEIKQFADRIGIHPGIVVGRLQHEGHAPKSHYNDLRIRYHWITD